MSDRIRKNEPPKRRPFWLPATSFYFLVFGLAVATFFLFILIFHEGGNDVEVVTAGLVSSGVLVLGVVVREVVLRGARERYIIRRQMLDRNLRSVQNLTGEHRVSKKFTLEANSIALDAIRKRSDAAKVFGRIAAGHREVFELCEEYRRIVAAEIPNTHPDSPRLKAMVNGKQQAAMLQEYHLLRWAEIESTQFTEMAIAAESDEERSKYALWARNTIELALRYYPENEQLRQSEMFLESLGGLEIAVDEAER